MSLKSFTSDPQRESLYVYAQLLVTQAIREELLPEPLDKTMQELSALTEKSQVIEAIFDRVMARVAEKFKNDAKIIKDCPKKRTTPEDLKVNYIIRVHDAVKSSLAIWQAKHPEIHFTESHHVALPRHSLLDECAVL